MSFIVQDAAEQFFHSDPVTVGPHGGNLLMKDPKWSGSEDQDKEYFQKLVLLVLLFGGGN